MSDKTTPTLGTILTEPAGRDAVHIAVAPVLAKHLLRPGDHIGWADGGNTGYVTSKSPTPLGVVDPYLRRDVLPNERFWLFLYPNTITGLRHVWMHPRFDSETAVGPGFAEQWLRRYAARLNSYDSPDEAFANLIEGLRSGELYAHGSDLHGLYELDDADKLKRHAEEYLGITIDWNGFTFSCSC